MKNSILKTKRLAKKYHKGQVDKAGVPYIRHPLAVAKGVKGRKTKIVALLHDTLEDTTLPLETLEKHFTEDIVDAIKVLTKPDDMDYVQYIKKVSKNELATMVKLSDLHHNMDITRLNELTDYDFERLKKYHNAYQYLKAKTRK